jgi:GNAT superfamily N-acetyltransferase
MRERLHLPLLFRRGGPADAAFVKSAAHVFSYLGDYPRILPTWLAHDGVVTHLAEEGDRTVGLTMLGFYPAPRARFVADLLAIAVVPSAQNRGVGRALLEHAIEEVKNARKRMTIRELRLSVAEDNDRALHLFHDFGFTLQPGEHGRYDRGQAALHMTLRL